MRCGHLTLAAAPIALSALEAARNDDPARARAQPTSSAIRLVSVPVRYVVATPGIPRWRTAAAWTPMARPESTMSRLVVPVVSVLPATGHTAVNPARRTASKANAAVTLGGHSSRDRPRETMSAPVAAPTLNPARARAE